jgi:hypothetical protein
MKILPYENFTISTPDSLAVIIERLSTQVEPTKIFRFSRQHALYQGTISEQGFKITRIIHYRNSFLPVIRGRFEVQPHQTIVDIQMSPHPFVMVFIGFWCLFWYGISVPFALNGAFSQSMAVVFLGMPIVILVIFWIAFWTEAKRSRHELSQIIQGQL